MNDRERIGKRIAEIRKLKGISQMKLAELANIRGSHIARIELGQLNAGIDTIARLCKPLGVYIELVEKKD